ncbi:uroporphyrinogen-III synthase [Sulfurimonas marina]|uniref:Uroporphyrinogen-III synthase n=1 Tax=Sulfurimonas marina TaxID=2590551 RepID=A0A7M1AWT8_9BACT|nr:uroporphyrinogen-III synthase [Sulfurimonas marina]QOP41927.1 uroporphyrinogen-III synthase [Sulfurimonas marina]
MSKNIYLFSTSSYSDTIHINSLDTTFFKPEIDFSQYDYLIVTSKQIAKALQQYDKASYIDIPALCVSAQSAKSFESIGGKVLQIGAGYGDNLSKIIQTYPKEKSWLYLRAKEVASSFVEETKSEGYMIDEAIVYETACSNEIQKSEPENDAILIFTSPSSVKCFLENHSLYKTQKIIVIGKTTAKALPPRVEFIISQETTIASCVKIAKKL